MLLKDKTKCINCKYNAWDCKNCYALEDASKEPFFPSIIFTFVLTRQCNLRCNYCGINFSDDTLKGEIIDIFLEKLSQDRTKINNLKFEFFGGEPLLEFEKIKYIVDKTKDLNIGYSIVTNGFFLNEEMIDFFCLHNFEIVFSVAIHTKKILLEKKELFKSKSLNNFIINFIIEPGKELEMYDVFIHLIKMGFNKITILPVYYTKRWTQENLRNLDILLKQISKFYYHINLKYNNFLELFYIRTTNEDVKFNVVKNDIELFLDYDGKIYGDYDTELRLLKDFVGEKVFSIDEIYLGNLLNDYNLLDIIQSRKKINTIKYIDLISSYFNLNDNLKALGSVISMNNVNLKK